MSSFLDNKDIHPDTIGAGSIQHAVLTEIATACCKRGGVVGYDS